MTTQNTDQNNVPTKENARTAPDTNPKDSLPEIYLKVARSDFIADSNAGTGVSLPQRKTVGVAKSVDSMSGVTRVSGSKEFRNVKVQKETIALKNTKLRTTVSKISDPEGSHTRGEALKSTTGIKRRALASPQTTESHLEVIKTELRTTT